MSEQPVQGSSDPFPFLQVDRSAKQPAAMLALLIKVEPQHALGTLIWFWELCGSPRELEKLVISGVEEVVLPRDKIVQLFRLASGGYAVEPDDLVPMELLEPRGEGLYRVRGMSRYFNPIKSRIQGRAVRSRGGKARSLTAERRDGRFTSRVEPAEDLQKASSASAAEPAVNQQTASSAPADRQQTTSAEGRGQRAEKRDVRTRSAQEAFFGWAQSAACERRPGRLPEGPPTSKVLNSQLKTAMETVGRAGLEKAWRSYLRDKGAAEKGWPWPFFVAQWERHFNAAEPSPTTVTKRIGLDLTTLPPLDLSASDHGETP